MNVEEVVQMLFVLVSQFNISYKQQNIGKSAIFEIQKFGVKIVYLDGQEFDKRVLDGWYVAWIHPDYDLKEAREKIVWALVRGGYFHYLRTAYKKTFGSMISSQGWDRLLIEYRMKLFKNEPKYAYQREINEDAIKMSPSYLMSLDPGFFDWLVEG